MVSNRMLALVLAVLALAYLWMAFKIPVFPIPRPIDSDAFPKLLGFVMLGLSVWLYFDTSEQTQVQEESDASSGKVSAWQRWQPIVITSLAIAIYAAALGTMGFVVASALLTAGLTYYFGFKKHTVNALVSFLIPFLLYILMTRVMNIRLPAGWLPI